jgi:hypothetical protein
VEAVREAPERGVVSGAYGNRICHRAKCRLHPRNLHSLEAISGFESMETGGLEVRVRSGSHERIAREHRGTPSGHFYDIEAISGVCHITYFPQINPDSLHFTLAENSSTALSSQLGGLREYPALLSPYRT